MRKGSRPWRRALLSVILPAVAATGVAAETGSGADCIEPLTYFALDAGVVGRMRAASRRLAPTSASVRTVASSCARTRARGWARSA